MSSRAEHAKKAKSDDHGYNSNSSFIKNLKQEDIPQDSEDDVENNDKFLEELEKENRMLERELAGLVQMKKNGNSPEQIVQSTTSDNFKVTDLLKSAEKIQLEKIEEKTEEDHPSYSYSNSEDDEVYFSNQKKAKKKPEPITERTEGGLSDIHSPKYEFVDWQSSEKSKRYNKTENRSESNSPNKEKDRNSNMPFSQTTPVVNKELFLKTTLINSNGTKEMKDLLDKENVNSQNRLAQSLAPSQRSSKSVSTRSKQKEQSMSPPKTDKVSSLEYRLVGANKAIKSLEKDLKGKDEKIHELMKEIEKKNKIIDMQQSNSLMNSNQQKNTQAQTSLATLMRKKEKTMEKKLKDQEVIINENKKYMIRLQELNAKLLSKIKDYEEENNVLKARTDLPSTIKAIEEENKTLKDALIKAEELIEDFKNKEKVYDDKLKQMIHLYVDMELKSEKFVEKNKGLNDTLLNLITKYHNTNKTGFK